MGMATPARRSLACLLALVALLACDATQARPLLSAEAGSDPLALHPRNRHSRVSGGPSHEAGAVSAAALPRSPDTTGTTASTIADLRTPCLLLYKSTLERNAAAMRERATAIFGCHLRPHFKTVKTLEAAEIASGGSRRCLTVSTLAEARFLADGGFDDLLYAVPLTPDKIDEVLLLHQQLAPLSFHFGASQLPLDHFFRVTAISGTRDK